MLVLKKDLDGKHQNNNLFALDVEPNYDHHTRFKRMRKLTRKGLETKLQATVRKIVIVRDGSCVTCPLWRKYKPDYRGTSVLQAGHLLTRSKGSVKWDLKNIYLQCSSCNSLHRNRPEFLTSYAISKIGEKQYNDLVFRSNLVKPLNLVELQGVLDGLEQTYREMTEK